MCGIFFLSFQDQKLRESLSIGQQDQNLEDKTLSVCYGTDFVNVEWLNFVCSSSDIAQVLRLELCHHVLVFRTVLKVDFWL